ncbi:MAG: hypothetical protein AB1349_10550 [Elusimicrobiota bacterium]
MEIIEDYNLWKELRDLRNELSHDYEEDNTETSEKLNLLFDRKKELEKYLNDILDYLSQKNLP